MQDLQKKQIRPIDAPVELEGKERVPAAGVPLKVTGDSTHSLQNDMPLFARESKDTLREILDAEEEAFD